MTRIHAFGDDSLGDLDAVGLSRAIAAGQLSPLEAAEAALTRIDTINTEINGIAHDDRTRARQRAAQGNAEGVFAGVPSLIKNNTEFAGVPTTHGSAAVPPIPSVSNEPFTDQFLSTGVNILAASTLPAFGLTASTEFVDREPTRNPWNREYSCGASSGGSAALVAAGAVPIAHANDGGGSIRIPAACCGLVGLKPTRNRTVPAAAADGLPIDIISNGVVTRTVRDTAHFMAAVEQNRPISTMPPIGLVEGPASRRLKIGVVRQSIVGDPVDSDTTLALEESVNLLASLGHEIEELEVPVPESFIGHFTQYWGLLSFGIDLTGKKAISPAFERQHLDPFTQGLAKMFLKNIWRTPGALIGMKRVESTYRELFQRFDLVVSPTLAHTTPKLGYLDPGVPFEQAFDRLVKYVAFTPLNNAAGGPAITLPLAQSSLGLPIGVHFSADHGRERTLLELAYELEAAQPFARIQD